MDVKVAFVVVCLCALALTSTEAAIPKCCIKTIPKIRHAVMQKVYKLGWQSAKGVCDIDAILLYIKGRMTPICANPKLLEEWKKMDTRKA